MISFDLITENGISSNVVDWEKNQFDDFMEYSAGAGWKVTNISHVSYEQRTPTITT